MELTSLKDRVFVVTGATGATGQVAALAFAEQGASLALLDNDQAKLETVIKDLNLPEKRLFSRIVDLRDGSAVRSAAEALTAKFGRVDGLIHLVGGWTGGKTLAEASPDDFESMLGQHAWTTFHLFQSFGLHLAANKWGRVMIVSASTVPNPPGKAAAYSAAKAAQENLVLNLAAELKDSNVTANIIQVRAIDVKGEGKGTTPAEIVAAMLYLCSDEAAKVSGARIPVVG
ncbi:MAG TPA: SDR family NAD(P)-dependent oxidoreductase [Anaerolineales bacterium]|jgi:NAD(P)-dependent dehydrogenase (short-subunit alcohol dehydrogenase family)|nr:SDR family NAD(P)-dependent oxidoreductase [Anaerolineales bacterium]